MSVANELLTGKSMVCIGPPDTVSSVYLGGLKIEDRFRYKQSFPIAMRVQLRRIG
jgi:hypothetical protein